EARYVIRSKLRHHRRLEAMLRGVDTPSVPMRYTQRIDERRAGGWTLPTILRSGGDVLRSGPDWAYSAECAGEHKQCVGKPAVKRHHGGPPYAAYSDNSGEELILRPTGVL